MWSRKAIGFGKTSRHVSAAKRQKSKLRFGEIGEG